MMILAHKHEYLTPHNSDALQEKVDSANVLFAKGKIKVGHNNYWFSLFVNFLIIVIEQFLMFEYSLVVT